MFELLQVKNDFPLFKRNIKGKPIIYLDSAATSLKPKQVLTAIKRYDTNYTANIHRGMYQLSQEATASYDEARASISHFIGSKRTSEIIFTRNATESLNFIAATWGEKNIHSGDTIVTTIIEHHANFVPWQQLAIRKKAKFLVIPTLSEGFIDDSLLNKYITRTTKLFAFSAVSNVLGTIQNIPKIVSLVKSISPDCVVVVDAAQAVPHGIVNVSAWGADFIAFSGHKVLGPTGIGVVWGKYELLNSLPPYQYGGDMIREVRIEKSTFADPPQRFEAGTPSIAQAIGLGAAVKYLSDIGMYEVRNHEQVLMNYTLTLLQKLGGVTVYGPKDVTYRGGVISFTLAGVHPHDIAQILSEDNICIRAGHHCAMPLHTYLHVPATARVSFSVYTSKEDIDCFIDGLKKVKKVFQ